MLRQSCPHNTIKGDKKVLDHQANSIGVFLRLESKVSHRRMDHSVSTIFSPEPTRRASFAAAHVFSEPYAYKLGPSTTMAMFESDEPMR